MNSINRYIVICFFLIEMLIQFSCANQSPPTGGPKDETPPNLIGMYPEEGQLNFEDNKIELLFDERVDAIDVKKELIISPNINIEFRVKAQRNAVILQFEKPLPDSTTFSIDFRTSIKDITEKNKTEPIKLAFSTGPYIDTLSISGSVQDILTGIPRQDVLIGIYDAEDTLSIEKDEPIYFTKTDSVGGFTLSNIRVGKYKLYSLSEKDNSLTFNKSDELVGFSRETAVLSDTSITIPPLNLSVYNEKEFKLLKNNPRRQYSEIIFSKNIFDYKIVFLNSNLEEEILHNSKENAIIFYDVGNNKSDSIAIRYSVTDSLYQQITDEINIKFDDTKNPSVSTEFTTLFYPLEVQLIKDSIYNIELTFNKPIATYYSDSVLLLRGKSDTLSLFDEYIINHNKTEFQLGQIKAQDSLQLLIKKGAFMSVENDSSKKISKKFILKDPKKYGVIRIGVESNNTPFILQLLDDKYSVEQSVANKDTIEFQYVNPGEKFLRIIVDKNNNGRWDKGSFKNRIPAEKILFYSDTIKLKENWDIGGYHIKIEDK